MLIPKNYSLVFGDVIRLFKTDFKISGDFDDLAGTFYS